MLYFGINTSTYSTSILLVECQKGINTSFTTYSTPILLVECQKGINTSFTTYSTPILLVECQKGINTSFTMYCTPILLVECQKGIYCPKCSFKVQILTHLPPLILVGNCPFEPVKSQQFWALSFITVFSVICQQLFT